ncbi:YflJ family protein [Domibacillus epiphyticus]|uniref:DUF2639 domain-containing protein n=1 Tax=Domibacillus epiphyticus TaxID=1714355 RepID=A0A1V2AAL6_9BACI|nr:hypothetical protein BTO28_03585 [Domibacillus epiphyticus]
MAHLGSKGWYVKRLKEDCNVSKLEGKKVETFKTHILHNYYYRLLENSTGMDETNSPSPPPTDGSIK